jgi:sulfate transporter 3
VFFIVFVSKNFPDSNFVPPLIYAMLGSSKDVAVGTAAVISLLLASVISDEVSPTEKPELYMGLAMTAAFFAGVFQAAMGIFRYKL